MPTPKPSIRTRKCSPRLSVGGCVTRVGDKRLLPFFRGSGMRFCCGNVAQGRSGGKFRCPDCTGGFPAPRRRAILIYLIFANRGGPTVHEAQPPAETPDDIRDRDGQPGPRPAQRGTSSGRVRARRAIRGGDRRGCGGESRPADLFHGWRRGAGADQPGGGLDQQTARRSGGAIPRRDAKPRRTRGMAERHGFSRTVRARAGTVRRPPRQRRAEPGVLRCFRARKPQGSGDAGRSAASRGARSD